MICGKPSSRSKELPQDTRDLKHAGRYDDVLPGRGECPHRHVRQAGSALVEFSLVILPLFAILFMTLDVCWVIFASGCIQEGAREGVRYAITGSGQSETTLDSATKLIVQRYSFGFAKATNISVDYYPPAGYSSAGAPANIDGTASSTDVGNIVKITVQGVTIGTFGPIYRAFSPIKLSASATDILQ